MVKRKKSIWQIFALSGAISTVFYALHLFVGEYLCSDYDPIRQTVSELTASGAPNAQFLRIFTNLYAIFALIFAITLYFIFRKAKVNRVAQTGAVLLFIMEITTFIGYYLFALDIGKDMLSFSNLVYMTVTIVVVICTVSFAFFTGVGLRKSVGYKGIGSFVFYYAFVLTIFGTLTSIMIMRGMLLAGMMERINIFSLMICIFVLSISLFRKKIVPSHTIFINSQKKKKIKRIDIQYNTGKRW